MHLLFADPLLVLIEYIPYGDLLGYLRKSRGLNDTYFKDPDVKPETNLTSKQLMRFSQQIADGMNYLCSIKVREANCSNLLKSSLIVIRHTKRGFVSFKRRIEGLQFLLAMKKSL